MFIVSDFTFLVLSLERVEYVPNQFGSTADQKFRRQFIHEEIEYQRDKCMNPNKKHTQQLVQKSDLKNLA